MGGWIGGLAAEQMFLILLGMLGFKWEYPGFIDKPSTFHDMRGTLNSDHQAALLLDIQRETFTGEFLIYSLGGQNYRSILHANAWWFIGW